MPSLAIALSRVVRRRDMSLARSLDAPLRDLKASKVDLNRLEIIPSGYICTKLSLRVDTRPHLQLDDREISTTSISAPVQRQNERYRKSFQSNFFPSPTPVSPLSLHCLPMSPRILSIWLYLYPIWLLSTRTPTRISTMTEPK